ncbi:hypothetical protein SEA_RAHALELUJAH_81 [Mycobacterium phage Rahalelujah]|nr:hypothetical protein SEA_RAHALELUJAH_81 [Mycobacterium phage Rahalelujah]
MTLKAKCKHCSWKVRADGSVFLHLSAQAHRDGTGHKVKIKGVK